MRAPPRRGRGGTRRPTLIEGDHLVPKPGYRLDESDSDVLVLRREDGSFVAAFSARGATREGIVEAAEGDRRATL